MSGMPKTNSLNVSHTLNNEFDDLDINSKRQKLIKPDEGTPLNQHDIDEYINFKEIAKNKKLNSSFQNDTPSQSDLDFKGGLVTHQEQLQEKICAKDDLLITSKPSTSSRGFANTFKLLESQVNKTNQNITVVKSACQSSNDTVETDENIALQTANTDEDAPTRFDLELAAIERIRSIFANNSNDVLEIKSATICPLIIFLFDFTTAGSCCKGFEDSSLPIISSISKEFPDILYHASKGTDGRQYLKIVRSLLRRQVLCGNRVSQMTRAYDDIEAVTRLLEEKEKDLELTVQIGKELLTQNNSLENKIADLEADLKSCNDDRSQLLHELHKKNELIAVLTNDTDDCENDTPTLSKSITFDLLQKKIASLQDENKSLKKEAFQLASQTDEVEEQERKLMNDITMQLNEANSQYDHINLELERHREENRLQHEQIVSLTARLAEAEMRLHHLTHDNDEHISLLAITKENQNSLALELVEFKQRYQEVLSLLQETQEQLRLQRKKVMPHARSSFMSSSGLLHPDCLQSELMESSLYSENSLDSGIAGDHQRINDRIGRLMSCSGDSRLNTSALSAGATGLYGDPPYKKVFETVRCASKTGIFGDSGNVSLSQIGSMSMSSSSGPRMSSMPYRSSNSTRTVGGSNVHPAGSFYRSSTESHYGMDGRSISIESLSSQSDDGYPSQPSGVPGAPGAKDLEAALKRLTPAEVLARRAMLSYAPIGSYNYDENPNTMAPLGIRTPDSIMSTGSSGISSSTNMSSSINQWRLPEKLQIVKPIEGSQTLNHWTRLATPTLSGLLEERPGVTIRGGRGLDDLGIQVYTLSDVEEDISEDLPGKQFEPPGCIYTYTTSMVMHPDDGLVNDASFLSQSQVSSRMASASTSRQPSCPPTPKAGLSRRNSCSTFSVNLGLATMLNERGIKAVTPSALNTPAGPNFSPTVTPCNSPEGSPTRSMSPEPLFGLLSSGADLIKRKLGGMDRSIRNQQQKQQKIMLSRLERRALRSLKLVEKVESIGLENIITTQPNAMSQLASGIASRSASPMAQLTSFKHMQHTTVNNGMIDDIHFDRNQIKGLLHRGLASPDSQSTCSSSSDIKETTKKTVKTKIEQRGPEVINNGDTKSTQEHNIQASASTSQSTDSRIKQMSRQKSRRNLKNGIASQRPDLGTISGNVRKDLGKVSPVKNQLPQKEPSEKIMENRNPVENTLSHEPQSIAQSFVGSVSSLLFGRKGGWL